MFNKLKDTKQVISLVWVISENPWTFWTRCHSMVLTRAQFVLDAIQCRELIDVLLLLSHRWSTWPYSCEHPAADHWAGFGDPRCHCCGLSGCYGAWDSNCCKAGEVPLPRRICLLPSSPFCFQNFALPRIEFEMKLVLSPWIIMGLFFSDSVCADLFVPTLLCWKKVSIF